MIFVVRDLDLSWMNLSSQGVQSNRAQGIVIGTGRACVRVWVHPNARFLRIGWSFFDRRSLSGIPIPSAASKLGPALCRMGYLHVRLREFPSVTSKTVAMAISRSGWYLVLIERRARIPQQHAPLLRVPPCEMPSIICARRSPRCIRSSLLAVFQ